MRANHFALPFSHSDRRRSGLCSVEGKKPQKSTNRKDGCQKKENSKTLTQKTNKQTKNNKRKESNRGQGDATLAKGVSTQAARDDCGRYCNDQPLTVSSQLAGKKLVQKMPPFIFVSLGFLPAHPFRFSSESIL